MGKLKVVMMPIPTVKVLSDNPEFPWSSQLNSMARQAHAERAWAAVERFYQNCRAKKQGKKGYP
jgi:putative transposase